jgi:hypothetical protein
MDDCDVPDASAPVAQASSASASCCLSWLASVSSRVTSCAQTDRQKVITGCSKECVAWFNNLNLCISPF